MGRIFVCQEIGKNAFVINGHCRVEFNIGGITNFKFLLLNIKHIRIHT